MELKTTIIDAYLNDLPIEKATDFHLMDAFKQPDDKRKDVVCELMKRVSDMVTNFPIFNTALWNTLFQDNAILDSLIILPVVGSDPMENRIVKKEESYIIIVDLIHIANFTHIVSQMEYILQNYISFEIAKLCIHETYPLQVKEYHQILDHMTFTNGLANYLAWNISCKDYKFYTAKYDEHKERAFGLLAQAKEVNNKPLQHKVLMNITHADFWNNFPASAGMFYFDDIYRDLGSKGIALLYKQGPKNFISFIFHT